MTSRGRWPAEPRWIATSSVALIGLLAGCTSEDATPLVPVEPTSGTTPHLLEPTDEMTELAEQQCLDDPTLDVGEVNAVDPENDEQILASVTVDCDTVR